MQAQAASGGAITINEIAGAAVVPLWDGGGYHVRKGVVQFGAMGAAVSAVGVCASPAAAFGKKLVYTFSTPSGSSYCDGISLTTTDKKIYQGFQLDSNCDGLNDPAGGFVVRLPTEKAVEVVTSFASLYPNLSVVFYINPTARTWFLYFNTYDLNGTNQWTEINSGDLLSGALPAERGGVSSLHAKGSVKLGGIVGRR